MIYLDNNATTRPYSSVVTAMLPVLTECYYNPASATSAFTMADKPRRDAVTAMTALLNAEDDCNYAFTSGATEANNWVFDALRKKRTGRVLISSIEHASIEAPAFELRNCGFEVFEMPVNSDGLICREAIDRLINQDTVCVSIIAANNETGVLQDIALIGKVLRDRAPNAIFHTDATQALGKIPIDMQNEWFDVDLLSFSAHKFHGPKGIGGLYIRPGIQMVPFLLGGGQEGGLRSGTSNTPGLAGMAEAAKVARSRQNATTRNLRDELELSILSIMTGIKIFSHQAKRLPNTSCFALPHIRARDLADRLAIQGTIVGIGSACSSGSIRPPKTLTMMGIEDGLASCAIRVSLSHETTENEIQIFLGQLKSIVNRSGNDV